MNLDNIGHDTEFFSFKNFKTFCKVLSVYDGDTVTVGFYIDKECSVPMTYKVRLYGIDTPELRPSRSIPEEERKDIKKKAKEAASFLRARVHGKVLYLKCRCIGKYGRLIGELYECDDDGCVVASINDIMVQTKHATPAFLD